MKILLSYAYDYSTTFSYIEKYLKEKYNAESMGVTHNVPPPFSLDVDLRRLKWGPAGKPDLFLFCEVLHIPYFPFGAEKLDCPTACYLIDVHRDTRIRLEISKFFDYIFIAQKDFLDVFKAAGNKNVYWLPLGCDPQIHKDLCLDRVFDIGFVGQTEYEGYYRQRKAILSALSKRYKVNDYSKRYDLGEMARIYSQAKIVFNNSGIKDLNMRVFESMACGSLLITDRIKNGLLDLFQDKTHLAVYDTAEQALQLADYYLKHPEERQKIAKAGQELVISRHTYGRRAEEMLDIISKNPGAAFSAVMRRAPEKQLCESYAEIYSWMRLVDAVFNSFRRISKDSIRSPLFYKWLLKTFARKLKYFNVG